MERWSGQFAQASARIGTVHELGAELIRLRHMLEPRLVLAQLPAWPEEIRAALLKALRADLVDIQSDLERALAQSRARGRSDRADTDELVAVARKNSFVALLSTAIEVGTPTPLPQAAAMAKAAPMLPLRGQRRILIDRPMPTDPRGRNA